MPGIPLPSTWVSSETGQHYERYEIKLDNPEYKAVIDNITKSGGEMYVPLVYKVRRK